MKSLLRHLNIVGQCRSLDVPLWSCPQFLFVLMGGIIIASILASYAAAARYTEPEVALIIVFALAGLLIIIAYIIVRAFERVVEARLRERTHAAELMALKDQFVFIAAHELRAPTTAIKWAIEIIQKKNPDIASSLPQQLMTLSDSSDRLLRLVEDILQVSRVETGVVKVVTQAVSVRSVVMEAVGSLAREAEKRGIALIANLPTDVPEIVADPVRLREVLDNLISNAIKYNKVGGTVTVNAEVDKEFVTLSIADTGVGLTVAEREHIFEKFWRAKETRSIEGTGLGLFIVHQLVTLMKGSISFVSKAGEGTTFYVRFKRNETGK